MDKRGEAAEVPEETLEELQEALLVLSPRQLVELSAIEQIMQVISLCVDYVQQIRSKRVGDNACIGEQTNVGKLRQGYWGHH